MGIFFIEVLVIFLLIVANGFFAGSEIAIISARRSRMRQLADEGNLKARRVQQLQNDPDRFLATIQIGVTVMGSLASAVGGAVAVSVLQPALEALAFGPVVSELAAFGIIVGAISYLLLTFGELFPKSLALRWSEPVALWVARPIEAMSRLAAPLIRLLTAFNRLILWPLGGHPGIQAGFTTEEDIKHLLREGREKGVFDPAEQELIHSVFEFTDIAAKEVMVPRGRISGVRLEATPEEVLRHLADQKFSRYPVYGSGLDDIRGILNYKDILAASSEQKPLDLNTLIRPAYFVPETTKISHLLKELQRRRTQMAIVVNEYGSVEGLVTVEDLIEEIVGEIRDEYDVEDRAVERLKDGSLVIDAALSIRDLKSDYGLPLPESAEFETLAGFVMTRLQGIPKGGEIIMHGALKLTVVDMDRRRVAKVKVERAQPAPPAQPVPAKE